MLFDLDIFLLFELDIVTLGFNILSPEEYMSYCSVIVTILIEDGVGLGKELILFRFLDAGGNSGTFSVDR